MKRSMFAAACLFLFAGAVYAQSPGSIGLYADAGATDCNLIDDTGLVTVYVVHVFTPGATASAFMVDHWSWGAYLTLIGHNSPYATVIGDSETGVSVAYGGCVAGPNLLLEIHYLGSEMSPACSYIQVRPNPTMVPPGIYVTDCANPPNLLVATGGSLVVNPDMSCSCDVPAEETTWGQVKALYR